MTAGRGKSKLSPDKLVDEFWSKCVGLPIIEINVCNTFIAQCVCYHVATPPILNGILVRKDSRNQGMWREVNVEYL